MTEPFQREPAVPIKSLFGRLPKASIIPDVKAVDAVDIGLYVEKVLANLPSLRPEHISEGALWRDLYAFCGTHRTFAGPAGIAAAWRELGETHRPHSFEMVPGSAENNSMWLQARFTFRCDKLRGPATECSGTIRIVPEDGEWKIWMLNTFLEGIEGFPNVDVLEPKKSNGVSNGVSALITPPLTPEEDGHEGELFDVVLVGAGFGCLSLAGRLKALGVGYVALDKMESVGDNWATRYDSVKIHTPKEYGTLPFERTFGPDDPYFLTAKILARGCKEFVEKHDLNLWLSTEVKSAQWDERKRTWTVHIIRSGNPITIQGRHLVFGIGGGGQIPKIPDYPNKEVYQGTVLHSGEYKNPLKWRGKKGIVVGTANTAHDVAEDMENVGLSSVTMVQRGYTPVIVMKFMHRVFDTHYNLDIPIETGDRLSIGPPMAFIRLLSIQLQTLIAAEEKEFYDAIEATGFKLDRHADMIGFLMERFGGHYIDVGCSQKIIDGKIAIKSDSLIARYTPTGVEYEDGSTQDADLIVFCTGFEGNMRLAVEAIVGEEVGAQLEDFWGVDKEGELRGVWKPMKHPRIWYTGGGIAPARFYSRFMALAIKAELEGVPLDVYTKTPS